MKQDESSGAVRRVALLGNHLPRRCGIATFTADLADAISATFPGIDCGVIAMNDAGKIVSSQGQAVASGNGQKGGVWPIDAEPPRCAAPLLQRLVATTRCVACLVSR
jgi:hypothetical protein